jgi:hypothetical protein
MLLFALLAPAMAQDAPKSDIEIRRLADIYQHLPPPGATRWDPAKLVNAVDASTIRWTPNHVYELIDKQVPEPIIKVVASKVGLFYDGTQLPLDVQAANARKGASPETITLNEANFGDMFTWFEGIFKDMATAEDEAGIPAMRQATESVNLYERRQRAWEEERIRLVGPHEGRIQSATFVVSLPATTMNRGGCDRPVAIGDASAVDFDLFRNVMGTRLTETPIQLTSHSVETMAFVVGQGRQVVATGRCGAKAGKLEVTLKRSGTGAWTGNGDFK